MVELPQVRHAERLFGDPDYLLRIVARDLDSYATLRDQRLATLAAVRRLTSTIVMKRVVEIGPCRSRPEAAKKAEAKRPPHPRAL